jgi:hypothetical protein
MDMAAETRSSITVRPDLTDYRGLLKALSQMDKESQKALKDDVASISAWTANGIRSAAQHAFYAKQATLVAQTVKPARDIIPTVRIGGSKKMPVTRKITEGNPAPNAGQLLFGSEFGGERNAKGSKSAFPNGGYKFPPRSKREGRGNAGYWIFPTLKDMQPEIKKRWFTACNKVMDNWARNS